VCGEEFDDAVDGGLGALLEIHRVATCCDVLATIRVNSQPSFLVNRKRRSYERF
jgi:hypothetical protein